MLDPGVTRAGPPEAEAAMTGLMFEMEEIRPEEIVYSITSRGVVNVTFDDGVPEDLKDRFVEKLRAHPDISGANISSADVCVNIKR